MALNINLDCLLKYILLVMYCQKHTNLPSLWYTAGFGLHDVPMMLPHVPNKETKALFLEILAQYLSFLYCSIHFTMLQPSDWLNLLLMW